MDARPPADPPAAVRAVVRGRVQGVGFREATVRRARSLGVLGWVRNRDDGAVEVHAEGPDAAVEALVGFLREGPRAAAVSDVEVERVRDEGHEQFAVRYEQGGRVPWPEALDRGHAVFVLHGAKLRGGFALQRTRGGPTPQWLLVKRRDEHARAASGG
ncbi:MAG TPA: acylphosphatase [Conexibacter sp.]|nr:acylphosphatase [Conexibacter sp.]